MWIDEEVFYKVFKEHPDWFPEWVDEGKQIWNRQTGEIICEDGTLMHDTVYRPKRDYNNYWKDCFNDEPKVYKGGPNEYEMRLNADYVKDPEVLYYHNNISFEEFIHKNHSEIWDNCTLAGKWITLLYIDCDKVKVRVTKKEPEIILDFSKGVTHRGYTYGGTRTFDWSDFYNGKYEYEDILLDIPAGFHIVGSLESFKIRLEA